MPAQDFKEQLRKQIDFLRTSCDLYDAGKKDEAIRIANALRIIFHDTRSSTSLLKHLNAGAIRLLSTCEDIRANAQFWANLTDIELDPAHGRAEFRPKLATDRSKRPVGRYRWWSDEIIYLIVPHKIKLNRRDLVLGAANKDGGAHVDQHLAPDYEAILEGAGWMMTTYENEVVRNIPFKYGHLAALRQIGYEVLDSPDIVRLQQ